MKSLTEKERRFVAAYLGPCAGNGAAAAVAAGYSQGSAKVTASRMLTRANVRAAVADLVSKAEKETIADAQERREVFTKMLRDGWAHPLARLKAGDILNKMDGLYVQKHEISGKLTLEQVLDASRG